MALFAMTTLGTVISHIRYHIQQTTLHPLIVPSTLQDKSSLNLDGKAGDDGEVVGCFCGDIEMVKDVFMLDCDRCHRWFHGTCVGIEADTTPSYWLCDDCQVFLLYKCKY